jgi:peptidoglycan/LPS O-acetylase OafA/YrhL
VSFRAFYRRRALRLMPAYVAMIGLTVLAAGTIGGGESGSLVRQGVVRSLTYTSNIATAFHRWDAETPRLWEFTWSLAAEEQFYLLWPVLLVIGLRLARSDRARLALGGVTLAGFLASAGWTYHLAAEHAAVMRIAVAPDTRSGALLLGCAVAIWQSVPAPGTRRRRRPGACRWPAGAVSPWRSRCCGPSRAMTLTPRPGSHRSCRSPRHSSSSR